mgnify:CR=1 FL=1
MKDRDPCHKNKRTSEELSYQIAHKFHVLCADCVTQWAPFDLISSVHEKTGNEAWISSREKQLANHLRASPQIRVQTTEG